MCPFCAAFNPFECFMDWHKKGFFVTPTHKSSRADLFHLPPKCYPLTFLYLVVMNGKTVLQWYIAAPVFCVCLEQRWTWKPKHTGKKQNKNNKKNSHLSWLWSPFVALWSVSVTFPYHHGLFDQAQTATYSSDTEHCQQNTPSPILIHPRQHLDGNHFLSLRCSK